MLFKLFQFNKRLIVSLSRKKIADGNKVNITKPWLNICCQFPVAYKKSKEKSINVRPSLLITAESRILVQVSEVKTADKLMFRAILEI